MKHISDRALLAGMKIAWDEPEPPSLQPPLQPPEAERNSASMWVLSVVVVMTVAAAVIGLAWSLLRGWR